MTVIDPGSDEWWRRVNEHLEQVRAVIAQDGFVVQPVFPADESSQWSTWAYTVGFTARGLPELVCTGLPVEVCGAIIVSAAPIAGEFDAGDVLTVRPDQGAPVSFQVRAVHAADPDYPLSLARRVYGDVVRAVQLVWPDDEGRYPGDPGWDDNTHGRQPLLVAP